MDQQSLHNKVIQCSKGNKKMLSTVLDQIGNRKRRANDLQMSRLNDFRRQYEDLLKLNQQSQQQTVRLQKQLVKLDNELQELSIKNTFSRSRIKLQNNQIQSVKDQTYETNRRRRKEGQILKTNEEMKGEIQRLHKQIDQKQAAVAIKKQNYANCQKQYSQLELRREQMQKLQGYAEHKYQQKLSRLQSELKSLREDSGELRLMRERQQQKIKRNSKVEVLNEIRGLLRKHKDTYSNLDRCL